MSGVALRCPHCGTVQGAAGECEACREAEVKYFCTNHSPGLWLDGPACAQCGARFGDPAPTAARREPIPDSAPSDLPPPVRPHRMEAEPGPWGRREAPTGFEDERLRGPDPTRVLLDMLNAAARARMPAGMPKERTRRRGGCLRTLFMLAVLLFAVFVLGPVLLAMFMGYG